MKPTVEIRSVNDLVKEIVRLNSRNDELLVSLKSLLRLWEAQAITGTAFDGDTWAEISRECHKARSLIDRIEGGSA